jgi:capsular exopolysaccharide synthesis family protein
VSLSYYWHVLRTQWVVVLSGLAVGLVVAGAFVLLSPRTYEATVTIFVSTSSADGASAAYDGSQLSEQRTKSYEQLLGGPRLAREVADRLDLPVSATELASRISASSEPETVLLTATVSDDDPARAAQIANTLGDSFGRLVATVEQPRDLAQAPIVSAQIVEPADVPTAPASPNPSRDFPLGGMVGLALGFGVALLRTVTDTTVRTPESLGETIAAPTLGVVPFAPGLDTDESVDERGRITAAREALRSLRTNIQFVDVDRPRTVLVITSAGPGEGKTTTAVQLALTFAASGNKVLLVDADLRRPRIAEVFGLERAVGLTSVITGQVDLDTAVQRSGVPSLSVLTSGPTFPNPSELLVSQKTADLLAEAKRQYDFVLLDSPPLLPVTDAAALAPSTDGALLVCGYGKATRDEVASAADALDAVHAPIVGTILTMTPVADHGDRKYAGYLRPEVETPEPAAEPADTDAATPTDADPDAAVGASAEAATSSSGADDTDVQDDRLATVASPGVGQPLRVTTRKSATAPPGPGKGERPGKKPSPRRRGNGAAP